MHSLFYVFDVLLDLFMWLIIIWVVMSWLTSFNIINTQNRLVYLVNDFLHRITEPVLRPIRRVVPMFGGFDVSPVILILLIIFLRSLMREYQLI